MSPEKSGPGQPPESGSTAKPQKKPPVRKVKKKPAYEDLADDPLALDLSERFGEALVSAQAFLEQPIYTVAAGRLLEVMVHLRDSPDWDFDYLVDLTALDYLEEEKRFVLVYHLYSHARRSLIRVKSALAEQEAAPSVTSVWKTAGWMEREVYDLFGVEFAGHPDLRRILLPEDWTGHPLRKDYDIKLQDQAWIRTHLRIRKTPA